MKMVFIFHAMRLEIICIENDLFKIIQ